MFGVAERESAHRHYLALLDSMLDNLEGRILDVDLRDASEQERQDDIVEERRRRWPQDHVLELIEAQRDRSPDAPALRIADEEISYGALIEAANRLAQVLLTRGVQRGDVVALLLERSADFVVAMLAILKCGASYLPLEPETPRRRREHILKDSSAVLTITQTSVIDASGSPLLLLDEASDELACASPAAPSTELRSEDCVYIIYTSGSTGQPKGVRITHASLLNYAAWAREHYSDGRPLDGAFFSPVNVDLTLTSLFLPLVTGGSVVVYPAPEGPHDLSILDVFDEDRCDLVKLTPSHLRMLLKRRSLRSSRLQTLIVGGEDFSRSLALQVQDAFGERVAIYNEYGPTEATVGCMIHRYLPEADTGQSVPIGLPIANARVMILDAEKRPVPAGVLGELWIGGAGLALDYAGDPERTAESFIDSPFHPGERLYRSGDLAREDPGRGLISFHGRIDDQVKVRGSRVELGEVQACIEEHPAIESCVVRLDTRESAREDEGEAWLNLRHCLRCGLASNHPEARIADDGICAVCREFEGYRDAAWSYFRPAEELRDILCVPRSEGQTHDCIVLLSGGKDSTYTLYQVAALGLNALVFSLDNGFISDSAKANIKRVVDHLGFELVFAETPSMNEIFADSLGRFSNVCQGCFKTIYTLATNLACERGIRNIVTGLSRGQIFETRLAHFFRAGISDIDEIDRLVVEPGRPTTASTMPSRVISMCSASPTTRSSTRCASSTSTATATPPLKRCCASSAKKPPGSVPKTRGARPTA